MRLLLAAVLAGSIAPALAQDGPALDPTRLYLSSPEACAAAEAGSLLEGDFQNMRLGDDAIQFGEEAYCSLYQLLTSDASPELVATAVCSFGGQRFADQLLITPVDDNTVTVTSSRGEMLSAMAGGEQGASPEEYATTFTKCALDDLPR